MTEGMDIADLATRMLIADARRFRRQCESHIKFLRILQTLKSKYPDLLQFIVVHSFLEALRFFSQGFVDEDVKESGAHD